MSGTPTDKGLRLQREWSIPARQTRYHRKGDFFMPIEKWPGALADASGFVVFQSEKEMLRNKQVRYRGQGTDHVRLGVKGGIARLSNYTSKRTGAIDPVASRVQPRHFLIMVNSDACPGGVGVPKTGSAWEGGVFRTGLPRKTKAKTSRSGRETAPPKPGDRATIWVNETGQGNGLTAYGLIDRYDSVTHSCTVRHMRLFPVPFIDNEYLRKHLDRSDTLRDIRSSTVVRLRYLSGAQWDELVTAALSRRSAASSGNGAFQLLWHEGEAKNCTDILPVSWFERVGVFRDGIHCVRRPRKRVGTAQCDITVHETSADLNYCEHKDYNDDHDMQLGIMRIYFENNNRRDIAAVEWAADGVAAFELCDVEVVPESVTLKEDIDEIKKDDSIDSTTREQLIRARIGQGLFRFRLIKAWGQKCSVSEIGTLQALRASHIKPWRESTNDERLDPENGLLLAANLDALFDKYLITFDDSGNMVVSSKISAAERALLGIPKSLRVTPNTRQRLFLRAHRDEFEKRS